MICLTLGSFTKATFSCFMQDSIICLISRLQKKAATSLTFSIYPSRREHMRQRQAFRQVTHLFSTPQSCPRTYNCPLKMSPSCFVRLWLWFLSLTFQSSTETDAAWGRQSKPQQEEEHKLSCSVAHFICAVRIWDSCFWFSEGNTRALDAIRLKQRLTVGSRMVERTVRQFT